ncbi:MAG: DUF2807 domain-containing protein [Bacteroidota bacterium]
MKNKMTMFIAVLVTLSMNLYAQSSNNAIVTETRTSNPFHYIHIKGQMNVKIVQHDVPGVAVEGTTYQLNNTITYLRNDTLFVFQNNVRKQDSKTFVEIRVDDISFLEVSGNSKVDCTGLINTDFLTIRAYDGAQIKLDVRALKVDSKVTGCSFIDLSGIAASNASNIEGCGRIDTHLLQVLDERKNLEQICIGC